VKLQKLVEFNNTTEKTGNLVFVPSPLQSNATVSLNTNNPNTALSPNAVETKKTDEAAVMIAKLNTSVSPSSTDKPKKKVGRPKKNATPVAVGNEIDANSNGKLVASPDQVTSKVKQADSGFFVAVTYFSYRKHKLHWKTGERMTKQCYLYLFFFSHLVKNKI
jgi:hypothetical protein